jgi:hypothetical protein
MASRAAQARRVDLYTRVLEPSTSYFERRTMCDETAADFAWSYIAGLASVVGVEHLWGRSTAVGPIPDSKQRRPILPKAATVDRRSMQQRGSILSIPTAEPRAPQSETRQRRPPVAEEANSKPSDLRIPGSPKIAHHAVAESGARDRSRANELRSWMSASLLTNGGLAQNRWDGNGLTRAVRKEWFLVELTTAKGEPP